MADYSEGKIYLVKFRNDPSLVYVGSTKYPLNIRFRLHKKDYDTSLYKFINDNCDGNWNDCYIELYENYPCLNRKKLDEREGEITRKFKNDSNYNCINERIAGRTKEQYYKYHREYNENNKEKISDYHKEWYENNKEKINEKFTCSCGAIITKNALSRHLKTKKHLECV
jgi:hypothetical protein